MNSATPSDRSQYMLLLHQPNGPAPAPDELQQIMARFDIWMKSLTDRGMVVGRNGLAAKGTVLRGPRGRSVSDGPFPESKEIVGGYVLITANTYEEAVEAARDCPGLDYQMAVEVRPVVTCRTSG